MKAFRMIGVVVLTTLLVFSISCKKDDDDNGDNNTIVHGPSLVIKVVFTDWDLPENERSTIIEGANVEVYQTILNWNLYETPIYSGVTDSSGYFTIPNDSLINNGIQNPYYCYIFVHKAPEMYSNWTNIETSGKVYFDMRDSVNKEVIISKDKLFKVLSVNKWNLTDIRLSTGYSIIDSSVCIQDNYLEIKRAYSDATTSQNFIFNEGADICTGRDAQDTLRSLQSIENVTGFYYSSNDLIGEYGNNFNASINNSADTITFSSFFYDDFFQIYYVYKDYVAE